MLPFCVLDEAAGAFTLPDLARVRAARVVVATCGAAGILREAFPGPSGSELAVTHVMIDEAGQARALACLQWDPDRVMLLPTPHPAVFSLTCHSTAYAIWQVWHARCGSMQYFGDDPCCVSAGAAA